MDIVCAKRVMLKKIESVPSVLKTVKIVILLDMKLSVKHAQMAIL